MDLVLLILGGIAAVALGFWLGLPGKYEQTPDDIEKAMDRGGARRNQVKRVFTPLDWFRKDKRGSQRRIEASRRRFSTAAPEKATDDGAPGVPSPEDDEGAQAPSAGDGSSRSAAGSGDLRREGGPSNR